MRFRFNVRLLLCSVIPAVLFSIALAVSLWGLTRTHDEFEQYINTEQFVANTLNEMYAQGLQAGQALRNILLDPGNRRAYDNLDAAESAYTRAMSGLRGVAEGTPLAAQLAEYERLHKVLSEKRHAVRMLAASDPREGAQVLNREETPAWRALRDRLVEQIVARREAAAQAHAVVKQHAVTVTIVATVLALLAILVAALLCWMLLRTVKTELGGDPADARRTLRRIAEGDLVDTQDADMARGLMLEMAQTRRNLRDLLMVVRAAAGEINQASRDVAEGSKDLASRTESTAGNLQETAAAMEEISSTVVQTADSARQADSLAHSAAEVAERGGAIMTDVVATMDDINESSSRIADIVGTIDGIAFQTNILALNAAVEAARAGEQGRSFAVVAAEVRVLAQRSAQAAREIRELIEESVQKVAGGAGLVADAGSTMKEIVAAVRQVHEIIGQITVAADEQAQGIEQINAAVGQLDSMTQQNAAMVEQSATAAQSMMEHAMQLARQVGAFRLEVAEDEEGSALAPEAKMLNSPAPMLALR